MDQGGGKRKGSFAVYLEPWHADIWGKVSVSVSVSLGFFWFPAAHSRPKNVFRAVWPGFLQLKKNHGVEEARARDLFYALWVPDLFMRRVEANGTWSLFCPNEAPGLADCWGPEFDALYAKYEAEGRQREIVSAQKLWFAILDAQMETGVPYLLYKDACNAKSNHSHLGTIKCSNLCTEIVQYTSPEEVAVCNLASVSLGMFADEATGTFDFKGLEAVVKVVVRNLNRVIDVNFYPVPEAEVSNRRHRPIGVGVQGLADAFVKLRLPFESEGAARLNRQIFEAMYFAALTGACERACVPVTALGETRKKKKTRPRVCFFLYFEPASCELAKIHGPYESFAGSPMSRGELARGGVHAFTRLVFSLTSWCGAGALQVSCSATCGA